MPLSERVRHVVRAAQVALVVGPCLMAIQHFDALLRWHWPGVAGLKYALTVLVPFLVALYSSRAAARTPGTCPHCARSRPSAAEGRALEEP